MKYKHFCIITFVCFVLLFGARLTVAAPGILDNSFGTGGKVIYRFNQLEDTFAAVAIQPDGKIVGAGKNGQGHIIVVRYQPDGEIDTSFGNGGVAVVSSLTSSECESLDIQADGKLVVTGLKELQGFDYAYLVLRMNSDGTLDRTFDGDGILAVDLSPGKDIGLESIIQPDGKIVVTGTYDVKGAAAGAIGVIRINPNGTLDNTFDSDGIVVTATQGRSQTGYAVALQPDGKILVSANSDEIVRIPSDSLIAGQSFLAIVRYLPDGSLDTSFGNGGISETNLNGLHYSFGDIKTLSDGRIVVAGSIGSNSTFIFDFSVFGFLPNGSLDTTFGTAGQKIIDSGNMNAVYSLAIQPNGKIIVVGHSAVPGHGLDILVSRLNPDGSFDVGFGDQGRVYTQVAAAPGSDYGFDVALQQDGKIVVAGDFNLTFFDYDAVILRFLGDSVSRTHSIADFDADGKTDLSVYRASDSNWYVFQSGGGTIVRNWGLPTDVLTPGDFDGDGKADAAAYRPSSGQWYVLRSSDLSVNITTFGISGDIPAAGDYDGDGKADVAVFRPSRRRLVCLSKLGRQCFHHSMGSLQAIFLSHPIMTAMGNMMSGCFVHRPVSGTSIERLPGRLLQPGASRPTNPFRPITTATAKRTSRSTAQAKATGTSIAARTTVSPSQTGAMRRMSLHPAISTATANTTTPSSATARGTSTNRPPAR